ncbi:hypothetical protein NC653_040696 [Populus alba x Populus x berolinensis]|uniref:Uncharacterized protein n=1 Tax=Populus alba x Populus x berolinensis TaxID=444605 RepID=A0AAD6L6T3_9ROSI|nr:hypothetical protein NC653_040696 [Populus alba x Populus x berolinensis]
MLSNLTLAVRPPPLFLSILKHQRHAQLKS